METVKSAPKRRGRQPGVKVGPYKKTREKLALAAALDKGGSLSTVKGIAHSWGKPSAPLTAGQKAAATRKANKLAAAKQTGAKRTRRPNSRNITLSSDIMLMINQVRTRVENDYLISNITEEQVIESLLKRYIENSL
jgi:hypothetical protein